MDNKPKIAEQKQLSKDGNDGDELYLKYEYETDQVTGESHLKRLALSDGTTFEKPTTENVEKLIQTLKKTTGTENPEQAFHILSSLSFGMGHVSHKDRLHHAAIMLPALHPQDETEAMLSGQFLALQEAGMKCLYQAGQQDGFYYKERLYMLAPKLFAQANATMQTLLKYRSRGQQIVQVVHIHDRAQAIIAQNLSHSSEGGGLGKKTKNEPHG